MFSIFRPFKGFGTYGLLAGLGIAAVGYILAPQIKNAVIPAAEKGMEKVKTLTDRTKEILNQDKERFTGVPYATQKVKPHDGKPKNSTYGYENLINQLKEENRQSKQIIEELKNSVLALKEEVSHLKTSIRMQ